MFTNFCVKDLCCHRVRFEIGSYSLSFTFCYFIRICMILMCVHLHAFVCVSAILDEFVFDINVAFNLTWEGLGILLMTLSVWFDLVAGSDVTM